MLYTGLRKNWDVPDTFPNSAVIKAYKDAKVDQNKDKFTYGRPDLHLLRRFCQDKFGWQQDRADELLVPVLKVSALQPLFFCYHRFLAVILVGCSQQVGSCKFWALLS